MGVHHIDGADLLAGFLPERELASAERPAEVLLGAWLKAEVDNPGDPSDAGYSDETLRSNAALDDGEVRRLVELARRWPPAPVPRVRADVGMPRTSCEKHVPWMGTLDALIPAMASISNHTRSVGETQGIDEALACRQAGAARVPAHHLGVPVAITEAPSATRSHGRDIEPHDAGEDLPARCCDELTRWGEWSGLWVDGLVSFDAPWRGSLDPDEAEKHWGGFPGDRTTEPASHDLYPEHRP